MISSHNGGFIMPGMPRDDAERTMRDASGTSAENNPPKLKARRKYPPQPLIRQNYEQERRQATEELGETSDDYGKTAERDYHTDMTEGEDIARNSPDVVTEAPTGMSESDPPGVRHGFADDRDRPE
jgi:hypothetical protein